MPRPKKIMRNGKPHWFSGIPCPACKQRWETTTPNPNLLNHVKAAARNELLRRHLTGEGEVKHADWLKSSVQITVEFEKLVTLKVSGKKYGFKL